MTTCTNTGTYKQDKSRSSVYRQFFAFINKSFLLLEFVHNAMVKVNSFLHNRLRVAMGYGHSNGNIVTATNYNALGFFQEMEPKMVYIDMVRSPGFVFDFVLTEKGRELRTAFGGRWHW